MYVIVLPLLLVLDYLPKANYIPDKYPENIIKSNYEPKLWRYSRQNKKSRRVVSKPAIGMFKKYSRHSDVSIIKYYSFYK